MTKVDNQTITLDVYRTKLVGVGHACRVDNELQDMGIKVRNCRLEFSADSVSIWDDVLSLTEEQVDELYDSGFQVDYETGLFKVFGFSNKTWEYACLHLTDDNRLSLGTDVYLIQTEVLTAEQIKIFKGMR